MDKSNLNFKDYGLMPVEEEQTSPDFKSYGLSTIGEETPNNIGIMDVLKNAPQAPGMFGVLQKTIPKIPTALGTMASDVGNVAKSTLKAAVSAYGNIPKDIDYLKENIPAAGSLLQNDPVLAAKNALAGTGELTGKVSRIPPALANYLAHIGLIKPETAKAMPQPFSEEEVKNYMDKFVGENKPGGELIRGGFRNADTIYGATKLGQILNPLQLTNKNIVKDVLQTEKKNVLMHNKMYNNLWEEAKKSGFNQVPINTQQLAPKIQYISKKYPEKSTEAVKNFMNNPTLENAQKAQSDLGQLRRSLEEKARTTPLLDAEKKLHTYLSDAEKHIETNMFKNANGQINKPLQEKYKKISSSYRENVVPYKYNADIQAYKNKELLAKELVQRLKRGEFAAKKGSSHRAIGLRDNLLPLLGITGGIGGTLAGGDLLINKLLNRNSPQGGT